MHRLPLVTLIGLAVGCGGSERAPREPEPGEPVLAVLTYNVNYGLAGDAETLEAIGGADAGLVVLQETTPEWEAAIRARYADDYPQMLFHHSRGAGGLAVLTRFPMVEQELIEAPSGWFPALRVVVESPLGPVQLLAVHLRPPVSDRGSVVSGYFSTGPVREQEITEYLAHLDPEIPTIVAGDLNERSGRAVRALRRRGITSALPELDGRRPTWRWRTSLGEVRAQLDHVAHDARLRPLRAEVLSAGRSDHLPLLVVLCRAGG